MKFNFKKIALVTLVVVVLACMMSVSAFAAGTGDVAGAVLKVLNRQVAAMVAVPERLDRAERMYDALRGIE